MNPIVDFLNNNKQQLLVFFIGWLPTLLFFITILGSVLVSVLRGVRKTRIAIIHSLIAFTICLVLFLALVNDPNVDAFILNTVNTILGGPGRMQQLFGVSQSCKTFREIFIEYIPNQLNFMDGLALIARENGKYLSSLVDVMYRFTFGIVLYVLYWIIKFILWIISLIFYPEYRYIRKRNKKYENGYVDTPYSKNRKISAILGLSQGLVTALVSISFLGMFFYIIAGGTGDGSKREKMNIEDPTISFAVDAYSEIESYGTKGIFKVLNAVRDEKNMPYYLFAANMIFQGKVQDEEGTTNVYFVDELATYVDFSRNTFNLFLKYDKDNIVDYINQKKQINIMDEIINVFKNQQFQNEFEKLINDFESKTYFVNLTYSLVDSLASHLTEVSFTKNLSSDILVPLRILFEKGYLCDQIPYENSLRINKDINYGTSTYNEAEYTLDYIKPSDLLTKNDIVNIYKVFIKFITSMYSETVNADIVLNTLNEALPYIKRLSILDGNRKNELDGVFKRIYAYLENKYLGGESEVVNLTSASYDNGAYASISWVEELSMLVDVLDTGITVYYNYFKDTEDYFGSIIKLFDPSNEVLLEKVLNTVSSSRIIGQLFGTKFFVDLYYDNLSSTITNLSFPEGISFGNIYDNDGHFKDYGEFYYAFKGLKQMMKNPDTTKLLNDIKENNISTSDPIGLLKMISGIINTEVDNTTVGDVVVNSRIINSILSAYLIQNKNIKEGISIYIDDSILEKTKDGEVLNIIEKEELKTLFSNFSTFIDIAEPIINGGEFKQEDLIGLIKDEKVISMLDSKVIEGTISYIMANNVSGTVIIPKSMKDGENLVTTKTHTSEIRKLIQIVNEIDIDLSTLMNTNIDKETQTSLINLFKDMDTSKLDLLLSSNILYYTISNFLIENGDRVEGALHIIVPAIANDHLENDSIDYVIKKEILREFIYDIRAIITTDEVDPLEILTRIIKNKYVMDNMIISVTVANLLANEINTLSGLRDALEIPTKYNSENYGNKENLKSNFSRTNPWYLEAKALVDALSLVLNLKDNDKFNTDELADEIIHQINTLNDKIEGTKETKLDRLYNSEIFVRTLSKNIDKELSKIDFIDDDTLNNAKEYGGNDYKKSEIRALVNVFSLYDLDIESSNIGDSILEDVTNNLLTYNDKVYENNTKSKIDLLYESFIVKSLFTENINNAIKDGDLADLDTLELCYDDYRYFRQGEIETLINLCEILGIDDINDVNQDRVMQNINNITTNDIDNLYRYNITSILFASILKKSDYVTLSEDAKIKKNNKTYEAVNIDEAKALVYSLNALGIDINNLSLNDIDLNNIDLDIVSKSTIVSSMFYNSIKNVDDIVIPKSSVTNSYIKLSEFSLFLNAIFDNKVALFGNGDIDIDSISIEPEDITNDVLISLCTSKIMQATLAVKISGLLPDGYGEDSLIEKYKLAGKKSEIEDRTDNEWISNNEMKRLVLALDVLGISVNEFNESEVDLTEVFTPQTLNSKYNDTETNFDICYKSDIMKCLISNMIYNNISEDIVSEKVKNYSYNNGPNYYEKREVQGLIDALEILNINYDDFNADGFDVNIFKDNYKNPKLYTSYIVKGVLTKQIDDKLSETTLKACALCYEPNIKVYKENEITSLFELVANSDLENYDPSNIDTNTLKNLIYDKGVTKSYIIVSTVSNNIFGSAGIIIPNEHYDATNDIIKPMELRNFIDSIEAFGIEINGVDINIDDGINMPTTNDNDTLTIIAKSDIFRATISYKLKINNDDVYVEKTSSNDYVKTTTDKEGKFINVVSSSELINIIKVVDYLSVGSQVDNISLDINNLAYRLLNDNTFNKDLFLSCSAMRVLLGEIPAMPTQYKSVAKLSYYDVLYPDEYKDVYVQA